MGSWNKITLCMILSLTIAACGIQTRSNLLVVPGSTGTATTLEIPEDYRDLENPYLGNAEQISEGELLYQASCSSCHGVAGEGDGPAAGGLEPKPKNLTETTRSLSDAYLYWRIADGGLMEPFNSVMPAWRGILNEEQIWQVILYLRTLER
jgi:mono/diheme cytochrome c family protein